jgi:hypothetical protein
MVLKTIYVKPVDRHIEGVIKADDEASLRLEVEEYVLTNEVARRLEDFLDAYNNYEGANGAWISGFFGSGKSHLLKMLALLLENRPVEGTPVLELFLPKCIDNPILSGSLQRAAAIPSKSILFNIDQKADVISKKQVDALLSVFVKVFDEMCGYYGKQGHIAQFERDLDARGIYDKFKQEYLNISRKKWETGREEALLEAENITQAYAAVTGTGQDTAQGILDKYRSDYKVSIEDFINHVHEYIKKQGPGFRLNFFVDEVGQFIADNVKLMTNLQTIAESLASKCKGRAWLIITAQEDMNTVVGEMNKQIGNDFSKIQDRFAIRMKLTSADVAEVIQKRLLLKNDLGIDTLSQVYHDRCNNFKTLFDFADGSQVYRNFQNREHFIHTYPFIPYQFVLFQAAIQNLSVHNAFEGRHRSVGERSMLSVFQQVAREISNQDMGKLATFDLMFEGIRTAVKSQFQRTVLTAEKHLDNQLAIRVLKALFLVKYIKEFKATIRNICIMMIDRFDCDLTVLRKDVRQALDLLEQQTYIQRSGELYEYLTDEEKDIEQEIKNTEVENADVANKLAEIIFDDIIKHRKIRYDENDQDYPFSKKLDDRLIGREYELAIHVISPLHENYQKQDSLKSQAMLRHELLVIMPPDERMVRDLLMYQCTEKYCQQNISLSQRDSTRRILQDKISRNRERLLDLRQQVHGLLVKADLFALGYEVEATGEDPQARIIRGFYDLIRRTYPNLSMLRGITYTEDQIAGFLHPGGLFGPDTTSTSEPEQEMMAFVQNNKNSGVRTTLKSLVEKFERRPYGWYLAAVLCILAKLCARAKIEVRSDANILENLQLEQALKNTHGHANVVLEPQVDVTEREKSLLKDFFEEFFDQPARAREAKELGKETADAFKELVSSLELLWRQAAQYPFLAALEQPFKLIKELVGKPYAFYLKELGPREKELLDMKEEVLDPVRRFMGGRLKDFYEEAFKFHQEHQPNYSYLEGDEPLQLSEILADPACFKGNKMQQAKTLVESLKEKVNRQLLREREDAANAIKVLQDQLARMKDFAALTPQQQAQLNQAFNAFTRDLDSQTLIAVIRDKQRRFEEEEFQRLLGQMTAWTQPKTDDVKPEYISIRSVKVDNDKPWLADEHDVDRYLSALKKAIMKEISTGKRVRV